MPEGAEEITSGVCFKIHNYRDLTYRGGTMRIANNRFLLQGTVATFTALWGDWSSMQSNEPVDLIIEGNSWVIATSSATLWQGIDIRAQTEANYYGMPQLRSLRIQNNVVGDTRLTGVNIMVPVQHLVVDSNILNAYQGINIVPRGVTTASDTASTSIYVTNNIHNYYQIPSGANPGISINIDNLNGAHVTFSGNVLRDQKRQVILSHLDTIMSNNNYWYGHPDGAVSSGYLFLDNNRVAGTMNLVSTNNAAHISASGTTNVYGPLEPYTP